MTTNIIFRLHEVEKEYYQDVALHNNVTLSELIKMALEEKCYQKGFMKGMKKRHKEFVRVKKLNKSLRKTKSTKHELYTPKNALKTIWDLCNTDYALRRDINMDVVNTVRKEMMDVYMLLDKKNQKLIEASVLEIMRLDKASIIRGLENRKRNRQIIHKDETIDVPVRDFDVMVKEIGLANPKLKNDKL